MQPDELLLAERIAQLMNGELIDPDTGEADVSGDIEAEVDLVIEYGTAHIDD